MSTLSLLLVWCTQSTTTQEDVETVFEENHDNDMLAKESQSALDSQMVWEPSTTLALLAPENEIDIVTERVEYTPWVEWFLAYPQDDPDAPWVVLIHERRWLNEHIEDMARVVAMQGYRALAVDLYDGVVAEEFEQARTLSSSLDQEAATANLLDAEEYLRTSSPKVASLGRCMGGKQSLQLSLASDSLDSTVIYYGMLETNPTLLESINQPVLWIFAENDNGIPPSSVAAFEQWLDEAWVEQFDLTIYEGVDHAFANPTWRNFAQEETIDAWNATLEFLDRTLMN